MKFDKIIDDMVQTEYKGKMQTRHLAVALLNGKPITEYKYNYHCNTVMGENRGSSHAEMSIVENLMNMSKNYKNYLPYIFEKQTFENSKRRIILDNIYYKKFKKLASKITIIVIRISKRDGRLMNSKPCWHCLDTLKQLGFKNIVYSTGDEQNPLFFGKIKNLETTHYCRMQRGFAKIEKSNFTY